MPRPRTGYPYQKNGRWYARVTLGPKDRPAIPLPLYEPEQEHAARHRAAVVAELAAKLCAAGHAERARPLLEQAGAAADSKALDTVRRAVDLVCSGTATPKHAAGEVTFKALGERWTSGELAREYPDHVAEKKTAGEDAERLSRYVYPLVGNVPLRNFTLEHARLVMRSLPEGRSKATRRHYAQLIHRVLALAVFPLEIIKSNPLPKGFLPKLGPGKAKGWIYPDEDAALLRCPAIPLAWRVFYGFLHREGPRSSEAARLTWADVDLARGATTLDENKTDDPRAWALGPGVVRGLRAWHKHRGGSDKLTSADPVFVDERGRPIDGEHLAEQFRAHLKAAGVTRQALFERTSVRQPIRLHDTRATFITIALATGKTEAWVQDRTGHKSSLMINRYRRAARTAEELGLGDLAPLDAAIPEFAGAAGEGGGGLDNQKRQPRRRGAVRARARASKFSAISTSSPARARTGTPLRAKDFKSELDAPNGSNPADFPGDGGADVDGSRPIEAGGVASEGAGVASVSPRAALLGQLTRSVEAALAAGDLEAARVAHRAIGELLDSPGGAAVVDLGSERKRRR